MEQLEVKYIIPYLPYKLKIDIGEYASSIEGIDLEIKNTVISERIEYDLTKNKPILRPLKEYENFPDIVEQFSMHSENTFKNVFFHIDALNKFDYINYTIMQLMFKHHLDIFGLIDKGLAIDINYLAFDYGKFN